jgi:hypothetical protein
MGRAKSIPNSEVILVLECNLRTSTAERDQMRCSYFTGCPYFAGLLFRGVSVYTLSTSTQVLSPFQNVITKISLLKEKKKDTTLQPVPHLLALKQAAHVL